MPGAKLYVHATNRDSEIRAYAAIRGFDEVKKDLRSMKDFPCELPDSFSTLTVKISDQDDEGNGTFEVWEWGYPDALIEDHSLWGGSGAYVQVDGKVIHDTWTDHEDETEAGEDDA